MDKVKKGSYYRFHGACSGCELALEECPECFYFEFDGSKKSLHQKEAFEKEEIKKARELAEKLCLKKVEKEFFKRFKIRIVECYDESSFINKFFLRLLVSFLKIN